MVQHDNKQSVKAMRVMQDEPTKRVLSDTRNVNRGWLSATKIRDGGVVDRWMGDEAEAGASASASAKEGTRNRSWR